MKLNLKVFAVAALLAVVGTKANANAEYFTRYESQARALSQAIQSQKVPADQIYRGINDLVVLGYGIMDLYSAKFAECRVQYAQVRADDAAMRQLGFDALETKYHDGHGLTPAPKHCYDGRSMVVHPYMAMALLREGRQGVENEIDEVGERAPKLRRTLGF